MSTTRNRRLRQLALERDEGRCAVCDTFDAKAQVDHILDLQFGGKDELANLQVLCRRHHTEKTSAAAPKRAKADRLAARHQQTLDRRRVGPKVTVAFLLGLIIGAAAVHATTPTFAAITFPSRCFMDFQIAKNGWPVVTWNPHSCAVPDVEREIETKMGETP